MNSKKDDPTRLYIASLYNIADAEDKDVEIKHEEEDRDMTDKEKVALLAGFIKGTIGSCHETATIDVRLAKEILTQIGY